MASLTRRKKKHAMKPRRGYILAIVLACVGLFSFHALPAATITIACTTRGVTLEYCREGAAAWAKRSGHQVRVVAAPSGRRLDLFRQLLEVGAPDIDVLQIKVIWPGLLAEHLIDLRPYATETGKAHFPDIIRNSTVQGRLVALPWFANVGQLYYRRDLLEKYDATVPVTWDELAETARRIQIQERTAGNRRMWGLAWQGKAYEGLTYNALEWNHSHGGGTFVERDGRISVNNPRSVAAIEMAASWIRDISPAAVLDFDGDRTTALFKAGRAVFMRHWSSIFAATQAADSQVKGRVGIAVLPSGEPDGKHAGTLGGWNLAVSRYSEHPREATDLALYLTSEEEQKRRAIAGSFPPTRPTLYRDPEVLAAHPHFASLEDALADAVPRPSVTTGQHYPEVSEAVWESIHAVLAGKTEAADALTSLEKRLGRMSRGGTHWGEP